MYDFFHYTHRNAGCPHNLFSGQTQKLFIALLAISTTCLVPINLQADTTPHMVCTSSSTSLDSDRQTEEPLITLRESIWTDKVNERQFSQPHPGTADVVPIYLWMRVVGTKKALSQLKEEGKLPIHHKWYNLGLTGYNQDGSYPMIDDIKLDAGKESLVHKLDLEVSMRGGYFDWRTWSMKKNIRQGQWRVDVVYNNNKPVLCGNNACVCYIEIK